MATLDRWRHLLSVPQTLTFPRLELKGRDYAPSIVVGSGVVQTPSLSKFKYTLQGTPDDIKYAFDEIHHQEQNPYDSLARFRLIGTDSEGIEWQGGYTVPEIYPADENWVFRGSLSGLSTDDVSDTVSQKSSTELVFHVPLNSRMALDLNRFTKENEVSSEAERVHTLDVLGSRIRFVYEPSSETLSIEAQHTEDLPATYAERWLSEPLRIMFGQLAYPRLSARNSGGGRAIVFILRSPEISSQPSWVSMWESDNLSHDKNTFWGRYADLLCLIALDRDKAGHPNVESHKVTRLYEEVFLAANGSRWVWALTFASSIEGLAKMLTPKDQTLPDDKLAAISDLVKHIKAGEGDDRLKKIAIDAVHRTANTSTTVNLRDLSSKGVITKEQYSAWREIRNSVMHGSLVSPYSSEEEDSKLLRLVNMMHALTRELLSRSSPP